MVYAPASSDRDRRTCRAFRRIGNAAVSSLFNVLYRQRTSDLYTGMKGMRRDALPLGQLRRDGFEHGVELATLITVPGHRIHDVPVEYQPRQRGASKMRHGPETAKLLAHLLRYWRPLHRVAAAPARLSRGPPSDGDGFAEPGARFRPKTPGSLAG